MRSRTVVAMLVSAAPLVACSTAGSTGPTANLTGAWTMATTYVAASQSDTFSVTGETLNITQTGTTFGGSTAAVNWYWAGSQPGFSGAENGGEAPIQAGTVSGDSVTFTISDIVDTDVMYFAGSIHGSTMAGTTYFLAGNSSNPVTYQGTWSATKP